MKKLGFNKKDYLRIINIADGCGVSIEDVVLGFKPQMDGTQCKSLDEIEYKIRLSNILGR